MPSAPTFSVLQQSSPAWNPANLPLRLSVLRVVYGLPDGPALILTRWVTMSLAALRQRGIAETLDAGGPLEALLGTCFIDDQGWNSFVGFTKCFTPC